MVPDYFLRIQTQVVCTGSTCIHAENIEVFIHQFFFFLECHTSYLGGYIVLRHDMVTNSGKSLSNTIIAAQYMAPNNVY